MLDIVKEETENLGLRLTSNCYLANENEKNTFILQNHPTKISHNTTIVYHIEIMGLDKWKLNYASGYSINYAFLFIPWYVLGYVIEAIAALHAHSRRVTNQNKKRVAPHYIFQE